MLALLLRLQGTSYGNKAWQNSTKQNKQRHYNSDIKSNKNGAAKLRAMLNFEKKKLSCKFENRWWLTNPSIKVLLCKYTRSAVRFHESLAAILNDGIWSTIVTCNHWSPKKLERRTHDYFVVNTMPADDLAPTGARSSAGTVMTKFRFCNICIYIHTGMALEELIYQHTMSS